MPIIPVQLLTTPFTLRGILAWATHEPYVCINLHTIQPQPHGHTPSCVLCLPASLWNLLPSLSSRQYLFNFPSTVCEILLPKDQHPTLFQLSAHRMAEPAPALCLPYVMGYLVLFSVQASLSDLRKYFSLQSCLQFKESYSRLTDVGTQEKMKPPSWSPFFRACRKQ